jgi:NAD(P)H-hydrate epimerase
MNWIVTRDEMRAIERSADAAGHTYAQMMERAGAAVAEAIVARAAAIEGTRVCVLVGPGNNGSDGLVAGRILSERGAQVAFYLVKSRDEPDDNLTAVRERNLLVALAGDDQRGRVLKNLLATADVVVDAVLGTGFVLPLQGEARQLLATAGRELATRAARPLVVAVDCPSGVDADSGGYAPEALQADLTVTLAAVKRGLLAFPAAPLCGEIIVGDIGLDPEMAELKAVRSSVVQAQDVAGWLPPRPADAHKGTFGRALIVAGCSNYPGAAALAGLGAYRVGAGLVTLAVPSPVQAGIVPLLPEATWVLLPHDTGVIAADASAVLLREITGCQAMLLGPGMGHEETTREFLTRLLGKRGRPGIGFHVTEGDDDRGSVTLPPLVIDADGLRLLAGIEDWPTRLTRPAVLTPHPGEMGMLTGLSKEDIQRDRLAVARAWAERWGHIVVLKGAYTVVASPDGAAYVLPFATAALARAGTGDVLAGAITGLLAQGVPPLQAALASAYLHGSAGELATDAVGAVASVLAGDVADCLPQAIAEVLGAA